QRLAGRRRHRGRHQGGAGLCGCRHPQRLSRGIGTAHRASLLLGCCGRGGAAQAADCPALRWHAASGEPVTTVETAPRSREEIARRIAELGPWFHNLELAGIKTAPDHFLGDYPAIKARTFWDDVAARLPGRSVLDIGCNAGFYAIAA